MSNPADSLTLRLLSRADFYEQCGFSVEDEVQMRFGPALRMTK